MKKPTQVLIASKLVLCILWPVSAYAASLTFGEDLAKIPTLSLLMTVILSTVMGATALLHTMQEEYKQQSEIPHLWLFVSRQILSSNAAGLLMFFSSDSLEIPSSWKAGAIMVAAFGGIWAIERIKNKFFNTYVSEPK